MVENGVDWVAIADILAGILGTLGGVGVGAFVTWKIQEAQIKHSDATRFQKERLDAYSQYNAAANKTLAGWLSNQPNIDAIDKFITTHERVRLVATDEVKKHAILLCKKFGEIQEAALEGEILDSNLSEFIEISAYFNEAARLELRIIN